MGRLATELSSRSALVGAAAHSAWVNARSRGTVPCTVKTLQSGTATSVWRVGCVRSKCSCDSPLVTCARATALPPRCRLAWARTHSLLDQQRKLGQSLPVVTVPTTTPTPTPIWLAQLVANCILK